MSEPELIQDYLAQLSARLPASVVAELADGLSETYEKHLHRGLRAEQAARVATEEFGEPASVMAAFSAARPAGSAARTLLLTGPLVGGAWAAVLLSRYGLEWPISVPARVGLGIAVLTALVLLATAALARKYRRAGRSAATAYMIVLVVDVSVLGSIAAAGLLISWPVPLAAAFSSARIGFALRRLPRLLAYC